MFWECDGIKEGMKTGDKETHEIRLKHVWELNATSWAVIKMNNDYKVSIRGTFVEKEFYLAKNKKDLERLITWLVDSYNDISE